MRRIGIMMNFNKPTELAKITALICKAYKIEVIYMRPKDVLIDENKIKGKVFINNKWKEKIVDIPPFIDVVPYCFKKENREVMNYLKGKTFLSDDRTNVLSKIRLQEMLKNDKEFSHLIIPTHHAKQVEDIIHYINEYSTIVLKPLKGIRGRGVYVLNERNGKYVVGFKTEERELDASELKTFFHEEIEGKTYIIQKYVQSRTVYGGDPFDCRVHVEKGATGKWEIARHYIRIGIGQKVISNVNQGGGVGNPEPFLKANFGDQWQEINQNLENLVDTLPYKIEELRGTHIMSLGMDIGIDRDGKLYLFEVNDGPDTSNLIARVAFLRSNYYNYILKNMGMKAPKKVKKPKTQRMNNQLLKEKNYYQKQYNKMINSTSWQVTKPIRWISSMLKNKK